MRNSGVVGRRAEDRDGRSGDPELNLKVDSRRRALSAFLEYLSEYPHICTHVRRVFISFGAVRLDDIWRVVVQLPQLRGLALVGNVHVLRFSRSKYLDHSFLPKLDTLCFDSCCFIDCDARSYNLNHWRPIFDLANMFASIRELRVHHVSHIHKRGATYYPPLLFYELPPARVGSLVFSPKRSWRDWRRSSLRHWTCKRPRPLHSVWTATKTVHAPQYSRRRSVIGRREEPADTGARFDLRNRRQVGVLLPLPTRKVTPLAYSYHRQNGPAIAQPD